MGNDLDTKITIKADALCCETLAGYLSASVYFGSMNIAYEIYGDQDYGIEIYRDGVVRRFGAPVRLGELLDFLKSCFVKTFQSVIFFGRDCLDLNEGIFRFKESTQKDVRLTEKEISILQFLYDHKSRSVSRKELLSAVWDYAESVETHTLETHIYRLRQKIEPDPSRPVILITDEDGAYRVS